MNLGMIDAYYLSWRLAYALNGLTTQPTELLQTYEDERRAWAYRIVTSDKRWNQDGVDMRTLWLEAREQITGCGVEEKPSMLISTQNDGVAWKEKSLIEGVLRTGRRLFNVPITRWADDDKLDLHDEFPSDGRYRILLLASQDFPTGRSQQAMEAVCSLAARYEGVVEEVIVHPNQDTRVSWSRLPSIVKNRAEMKIHVMDKASYETLAVDPSQGAMALIRPDGMVATTAELGDITEIETTLNKVFGQQTHINGVNH